MRKFLIDEYRLRALYTRASLCGELYKQCRGVFATALDSPDKANAALNTFCDDLEGAQILSLRDFAEIGDWLEWRTDETPLE